MIPLAALLLATATAGGAAVDGPAALRHASALASLGPHPWGSPRARAAFQCFSPATAASRCMKRDD